MSNDKNSHDIRLIVRFERADYTGCDRFRATVAYKVDPDPNRPDDVGIRNPCSWDDEPLKSLQDLAIYGQRDPDDENPRWYGWDVEYRAVHRADLDQVEAMVKRLRQVQRKMSRHAEKFGDPADLADFCARAADAIGATSTTPFGVWSDKITINGTHYRWYDTNGLRFLLDRKNI